MLVYVLFNKNNIYQRDQRFIIKEERCLKSFF